MSKKLLFLVLLAMSFSVLTAQEFKKVKVTLTDGITMKGKKAILTDDSFSVKIADFRKTYPLDEVQLIQAKEGKAGKWALGFGGGCAVLVIVSGIASGGSGIAAVGGTTGSYIAGGLIWTGIFAGIGAGIGALIDDYETVYIKNSAARFLKKLDFNVTPSPYAKYNFTVSYAIPLH